MYEMREDNDVNTKGLANIEKKLKLKDSEVGWN